MFGFEGIKSNIKSSKIPEGHFFAYIYYHLMLEYLVLYSVVCQTRRRR
jgi:hypothetical protein